jgi:hypothetical protein
VAHKYRLKRINYESGKLKSVEIIHRGRGGHRMLGVETSLKRARALVDHDRGELLMAHKAAHPNDTHFMRKHNLA